jgi:hypothetical protein
MPRAVQKLLGARLEVLDADAVERRQDAARQDPHVAVVAGVVLGDHRAQPGVVAFVGRLPRLPIPQPGVGLGHLDEPAQDEVELDRHRLLAPQGPVVVEHGDAVVDRHRLGPVLAADSRDEVDDGPLDRAVAPARQQLHSCAHAASLHRSGEVDQGGTHAADRGVRILAVPVRRRRRCQATQTVDPRGAHETWCSRRITPS